MVSALAEVTSARAENKNRCRPFISGNADQLLSDDDNTNIEKVEGLQISPNRGLPEIRPPAVSHGPKPARDNHYTKTPALYADVDGEDEESFKSRVP